MTLPDYIYSAIGKLQQKNVTGDNTNMTLLYSYNPTNKFLSSISLTNTDGNNSNYTYTYDSYARLSSTSEINTYAKFTNQITYDTFGRINTEDYYGQLFSNSKSSIKKVKNVYQNGGLKTIKDGTTNEVLWNLDGINARGQVTSAKKESDASAHLSNPIAFVNDPMLFNTNLLNGRTEQFKQANTIKKTISFFDRGIPDVLAYMAFFNQEYRGKFISACEDNLYSHVFLLPPWEAIYKSDDECFETFDESQKIHLHLEKIYKSSGYNIIEVPFGTIKERTNHILNVLENL